MRIELNEDFPLRNMRYEPYFYVDAQAPLGHEFIYNAMRFEEKYWFWFDVCCVDHLIDDEIEEEIDPFDYIECDTNG